MLNVENSSLRGFDWGCIWSCWQRTLLLFLLFYAQHQDCPILQKLHTVEQRCSIIRLTVLIAGLYQLLFWHDKTLFHVRFLSPYLLLLCFFQQQRLACRHFKLNNIRARNCKSLPQSALLSLEALLTDTRYFTHLTLNTHVLTADGWVGIFMCSKAVQSARLVRSVIRIYCKALFVCWQRMSRPVFAYIHLS